MTGEVVTPFVVDDARTERQGDGTAIEFVTPASVFDAIKNCGYPEELGRKVVAFVPPGTPGQKPVVGQVAAIASEYCTKAHLEKNWPAGFARYLDLFKRLPELPAHLAKPGA